MTRRPIVALVCDVVYPYSHGGREIRNQELLSRLGQRLEVHVYTMNWWGGPASYTNSGVTYHAISPLLPLYGTIGDHFARPWASDSAACACSVMTSMC